MRLTELLEEIEYECVNGSLDVEITDIVNDSRQVGEGSLFFCIKGAVSDGHQYAAEVVKKGARVLIVQDAVEVPENVTVIRVKDSRLAMSYISAAYYGHPARELKVIGVTGTKGKTTTTYMIKSILEAAGHKVGLIGTIQTIIGDEVIPAENTTPESCTVQKYFRKMADAGCEFAVMEVSSQGLMLHRTAGVMFEIGVFTNLQPDHIGPAEHESFEDYMACKSMLFRQCRLGIVNEDDPYVEEILKNHTCEVERIGFSPKADLRASDVKMISGPGFLGVHYHVEGKRNFEVEVDIPGKFSVYNSLTAIAVCSHFHVTEEQILTALKKEKVKGRIELIKVSDKFTVMLDYAHNAMSLESLLTTLREYHPHRLICLFGCGGNRDKNRRYQMGEVSGRLADLSIITSDNPRFENPEDIIEDILVGVRKTDGKYIKITDRKEAMAWAIHHGEPGDIIVMAGKGHETYQEIKGVKHPMDERVLIQEIVVEDGKEE